MRSIHFVLISTFILLLNLNLLQAQDNDTPPMVVLDSTWGREIIPFPIAWVPEIKFQGYEELRFAPHWSDPESDQFWTLVMGWKIKYEQPLSISEIETTLTQYFSGLMQPNHWATEFPEPKVQLNKTEKRVSAQTEGFIRFFDGFHTGKMTTVHLLVSQQFCNEKARSIVVIKISAKTYPHPIWDVLNSIPLSSEICD